MTALGTASSIGGFAGGAAQESEGAWSPRHSSSENWKVLVALADMEALEIVNVSLNPGRVLEAVNSQIGMGQASQTDLELMGITEGHYFDPDWLEQTIRQAFRYLLQDWTLVQDEADFLMALARLDHQKMPPVASN